ncbi:RagB/SusD family nutrient uptake outer membrane protein [Sphingobacterium sp. Lzh-3]|uniref:RagB/SusD family nutrient uptake outer membrane protein n=1 Tax=Sphingobacterium sp. Lzh-3 TaxID=3382150 RepID=UPI00398D6561
MKTYMLILAVLGLSAMIACSSSWLNIKPDQSLVVPKSVVDYQAWLDNTAKFNNSNSFGNMEVSADNLYVPDATFNGLSSAAARNMYTWAKGGDDFYQGEGSASWGDAYDKLLQVNAIIEGIDKVQRDSDPAGWDNVKGSALFFRAFYHYALLAEFCGAYDESDPLGIPIKNTANVNDKMLRSSLKQSYEYVLSDLDAATKLLPLAPANKLRPSRMAAWALLSRINLAMSNYATALRYAQLCLTSNDQLLDYNSLNTTANFPFDRLNKEVIFSAYIANPAILSQNNHVIDSTLYGSYRPDDLRKQLFFRINAGLPRFKGGYFGVANCFVGLAIDEVYLNAAECLLRRGQLAEAENLFNKLMATRWKTGKYIPVSFGDQTAALGNVLEERRKSLLFRCLRLSDIKRLNKSTDQKVTMRRKINGNEIVLSPNDPKYVLPIPQKELLLNPMPQNPR